MKTVRKMNPPGQAGESGGSAALLENSDTGGRLHSRPLKTASRKVARVFWSNTNLRFAKIRRKRLAALTLSIYGDRIHKWRYGRRSIFPETYDRSFRATPQS